MGEPMLQAVQAVLVAVISVGGTVVVGRLSKRAQGEQTEVDAQAKATEAWQGYAEKMEERLDRLEERFQEAERKHEEDRRRIRRLERERENDRDLIRRLVYRLRWALNEIRRLGGTVPDHYDSLADSAEGRLEVE